MKSDNPYHDKSMWKGASPSNFGKAKNLRRNLTSAEKKVWEILKDRSRVSYKFRRQHPIATYIADFYCHELQLIIEVDGGYHNTDEQQLKDKEREEILRFNGLKIIRYSNAEVESDIIKFEQNLLFDINNIQKNK
ncbi:MAG: endonuclease domain-containing protein [Aequorivita sp.]